MSLTRTRRERAQSTGSSMKRTGPNQVLFVFAAGSVSSALSRRERVREAGVRDSLRRTPESSFGQEWPVPHLSRLDFHFSSAELDASLRRGLFPSRGWMRADRKHIRKGPRAFKVNLDSSERRHPCLCCPIAAPVHPPSLVYVEQKPLQVLPFRAIERHRMVHPRGQPPHERNPPARVERRSEDHLLEQVD